MFTLLEVLTGCCQNLIRAGGGGEQVQLVVDVDNRSIVDSFKKERSRSPITHAMFALPTASPRSWTRPPVWRQVAVLSSSC